MNGPENYAEAQKLLRELPTHGLHPETGLSRTETLAAAWVHATLASAAATIDAASHAGQSHVDFLSQWREVQ